MWGWGGGVGWGGWEEGGGEGKGWWWGGEGGWGEGVRGVGWDVCVWSGCWWSGEGGEGRVVTPPLSLPHMWQARRREKYSKQTGRQTDR